MIARVGDLAQFTTLTSQQQRVQGKADLAAQKMTSGMAANNYKDMAKQARTYLNYDADVSRIDQYRTNIKLTQSRLELTYYSLTQSIDFLTDYAREVTSALDPTAPHTEFNQISTNILNAIARSFNARDGERRALFSGSMTDQDPIDLSLLPHPTLNSLPDYTYYQGDSVTLTAEIDEGSPFAYNVLGNAGGIEKALRAIKFGTTAQPNGDVTSVDFQKLQESLKLTQEAIADLSTLRANTGYNLKQLEKADELHMNDRQFRVQQRSDLGEADITEAFYELTMAQTHLTAAAYTIQNTLSTEGLLRFMR
ncbi:MAG: hypothetical protein ACK5O7_01945 [Holosporales bacterium]